jgi:photosystem II stability/assembly factor-like uncharacterized protein
MLIHTTDGGTTWTPQAIPATTFLGEVTFFSGSLGWAVGSGGVLLKSVDGGNTWTPKTISTTKALQSIWFADSNNGWIVGESGLIFFTTDGGETWNTQSSGTSQRLIRVRFVNSQTGWACGWGGTILYTANGGTTWTPQTSGVAFDIISISIVDANNVWLSSVPPAKDNKGPLFDNGKIIHTSDGGTTWQVQYTSTEVLNAVSFANLNEGWCFGSTGTIMHSTDGGTSWLPQGSGVTEQFTVGQFTDPLHGWATGENGVVVATSNGGVTGVNEHGNGQSGIRITNEPNPFNGSTRISYYIPEKTTVKIMITDVCGKSISVPVNEEMQAGNHTISWNASLLHAGVYFCTLQAGDLTLTRKMIVN